MPKAKHEGKEALSQATWLDLCDLRASDRSSEASLDLYELEYSEWPSPGTSSPCHGVLLGAHRSGMPRLHHNFRASARHGMS